MLWQAASDMRFRMPESYALVPGPSFNSPATATGHVLRLIEEDLGTPALTEDLRRQVLDELTARKVQAIIVGPMRNQQRILAFVTWLTGTAPQQDGGVFIWRLTT